MLSHNVGHQVEKTQYNQTAVMLLIETSRLVRDNTSRAVTSLDNMVLYFMKTKGSENETSLMGILHVSDRARARAGARWLLWSIPPLPLSTINHLSFVAAGGTV